MSDPRPSPAAPVRASPLDRSVRGTLFVAALAVAATWSAMLPARAADASAPPRHEPDCTRAPLDVQAELGLSADTAAQVQAALRKGCERERAVHAANRQALAALLTPEQLAQLESRLRPPPPPRP